VGKADKAGVMAEAMADPAKVVGKAAARVLVAAASQAVAGLAAAKAVAKGTTAAARRSSRCKQQQHMCGADPGPA